MRAKYSVYCLVLLLAIGFKAGATHIVGGQVTYKYVGREGPTGPYKYQVRLDIYQDCVSGDPNAIAQDSPAYIGIFDGNGSRVILDTMVRPFGPNVRVPTNFSNNCVNNPPITCLNNVAFVKTYDLQPNYTGYYIIYQRCCRNQSIMNIIDPGAVGATYSAFIPPALPGNRTNNSAVFNNYPPQIICVNNPLVYDHSATDSDGDSLSYEFCTAYQGGSASNAKPLPFSTMFMPVSYMFPFTATDPMGPGPSKLQINPTTGLITGTPNQLGRFVVTVCCHEWRNGVIVNTVTREFQFVVTNCSKAVVANIPQYSTEFNTYIVQCKGKTVHFTNLSTGGNAGSGSPYFWDFGVEGNNSDTSNQKEPDFTYPDTGVYVVKLVVNRNSTCSDSITRFVKIYPEFHTDFDFSGLPCPKSPIQFSNKVQSTYQPVVTYNWTFGDGTSSNDANPVHMYDTGGNFLVRLFAANVKGCTDTAAKTVDILRFKPFAGNDTIIVKGESIAFNAIGGDIYTWTPSTYLNNPNIPNPVGYYPDTTRLNYIVHIATESGCEGDDTINVWVVAQSAIYVPSGFTPNGDGRNDILRPIGIGYRNLNYFRVFNRWGQQVYYGTKFNEGWDGSYQGSKSDIGTYYWVLSVVDRFGKEQVLKGDATLIR
jgi:gliding motility-associated-like protein